MKYWFKRLLAGAIAFAVAPHLSASVRNTSDNEPLTRLAEWVLQTGVQTVVRSHILEAMMLPPSDMPVRERGFRVSGETFTHVCSVSTAPAFRDLIFFALVNEGDGSATVWRTSRDGRLISTVQFNAGAALSISNEANRLQFAAEKAYFLAQVHPQISSPADRSKRSAEQPPSRLPFGPEVSLIASNPLVLPVIIFALVIGARSARRP